MTGQTRQSPVLPQSASFSGRSFAGRWLRGQSDRGKPSLNLPRRSDSQRAANSVTSHGGNARYPVRDNGIAWPTDRCWKARRRSVGLMGGDETPWLRQEWECTVEAYREVRKGEWIAFSSSQIINNRLNPKRQAASFKTNWFWEKWECLSLKSSFLSVMYAFLLWFLFNLHVYFRPHDQLDHMSCWHGLLPQREQFCSCV